MINEKICNDNDIRFLRCHHQSFCSRLAITIHFLVKTNLSTHQYHYWRVYRAFKLENNVFFYPQVAKLPNYRNFHLLCPPELCLRTYISQDYSFCCHNKLSHTHTHTHTHIHTTVPLLKGYRAFKGKIAYYFTSSSESCLHTPNISLSSPKVVGQLISAKTTHSVVETNLFLHQYKYWRITEFLT